MSVNGNDKRQAIFLRLVEAGEELTPSEIGEELDETRQTVKYHLDTLLSQGLVVNEEGAYRAQPLFTEPEIESRFIEWLAEFVPVLSEHIEFDPEMDGEEQAAILFNCIRAFVALEFLEAPPEETNPQT